MAELIRDDPEWLMPGGYQPSPRRLRVWRVDDHTLAAVITERGPGMSVTNLAEHAHRAILDTYPSTQVRVFEHYPAEHDEAEHFDEITVANGQPHWTRRSTTDMLALIGPQVLDDLPPLPLDPFLAHHQPPAVRLAPPTGPGLPDDATVRGDPLGRLVTIHDPAGQTLGLLPHWTKHSPDGFHWGYPGSGPAELARSLLIAVLGQAARCWHCAGTGRLTYDRATGAEQPSTAGHSEPDTFACLHCDDGIDLPPAVYQQFKREVLTALPAHKPWQLPVAQVRSWLTNHDHSSTPGT